MESNINTSDSMETVKNKEWIDIQLTLKRQLKLVDELPWQQARRLVSDCPVAMANSEAAGPVCPLGVNHCLRLVAGADLSFVKGDAETACASLVVLRLPDLNPVHRMCRRVRLIHPYEPGFLSFREAPPILDMLNELRAYRSDLMPQALLLDGNGTLHPRGFGLACHVGVLAGLPTVGAAKSFFHVDGLDQRRVRQLVREAGGKDYYIRGESGAVHGCAHVPDDSVKNPVYVSCGHLISLPTAVWLVGQCCRYRVPEPIRMADFESREFLRKEAAEKAKTVKSEASGQ